MFGTRSAADFRAQVEALRLMDDPSTPSLFTEDERRALEDLPKGRVAIRLRDIARKKPNRKAQTREVERLKMLRRRCPIRFGEGYVVVEAGGKQIRPTKYPDGRWRTDVQVELERLTAGMDPEFVERLMMSWLAARINVPSSS
jgi:hypothetical protein